MADNKEKLSGIKGIIIVLLIGLALIDAFMFYKINRCSVTASRYEAVLQSHQTSYDLFGSESDLESIQSSKESIKEVNALKTRYIIGATIDTVVGVIIVFALLIGKKNTLERSIPQSSNADEILKYKKLLDDGVITAEEFEKKKKELLGV